MDELPDVLDSIGLKPSPEEVEVDTQPHAVPNVCVCYLKLFLGCDSLLAF